MNKLEEMKKRAELARLYAAKAEQEFKIMEFEENIERIKNNLAIQLKAIEELENELNKK
jgi:hypothetical protein